MTDRTIIVCGTERHTVCRRKDGSFVAEDHPDVDAAVDAYQIAVAFNAAPITTGCVPLLAMLRTGAAAIVDAHGDVAPEWMPAWKRYWKNPLVAQLAKRYARERDASYKELTSGIMENLPRSKRLPLDIRPTDNIAAHEDKVVGFYMEDDWKLPVARDWFATCSEQPLHNGKLVLGRTPDAVYVLANDKKVSDAWYVRKAA
jgi:hypothetical protein